MEIKEPLNTRLIIMLVTLINHVRAEKRLLHEYEVAYIFGINKETLRRWRDAGRIKYLQFEGGDIRYKWEHVEERMANIEQNSFKANIKKLKAA